MKIVHLFRYRKHGIFTDYKKHGWKVKQCLLYRTTDNVSLSIRAFYHKSAFITSKYIRYCPANNKCI